MIALALALAGATPLSQARAITLAGQAMATIDPTTPLVCLTIEAEHSSRQRFDLAVREVHDEHCYGDPDVSPVRERFRITRAPVTVSRLDAVRNRYLPCKLAKASVTCPAR